MSSFAISHEEKASSTTKKKEGKFLMKEKDNNFLRTELTYAIVLHANVEDIQRIKEFISGFDDLDVVYQRASAGKLYIREEKGE